MVASRDVYTHSIDADGGVCTFIDICAVASTAIKFVTDATFTSKEPSNVDAFSIDTNVSEGTFIYVFAGFAISGGDVAHVTFTAVASR